jgi:hypothetical protein
LVLQSFVWNNRGSSQYIIPNVIIPFQPSAPE